MSSLTLKNVPDELLEDLRETALQERRSVNQQALQLLIEALRTRKRGGPVRATRAGGQLAAWRALAGRWRSDEDAATETKRIYSRRTRGRKVGL
ncbi:MAG: hypothetical protein EHM50_08415 [Lysobacterales bacterium]|nr:MAG: hypothetical protein EHM50_08415 [Xanthomonadales bacterium]